MKARHILSAFALAMVAASFTGCVSKKQYTDLQAAHQQLSQDYTTLQSNYSQAQGNAQTLQALLDEARRNNTELKENYARLQGSLDKSISQNTQGNVNISIASYLSMGK